MPKPVDIEILLTGLLREDLPEGTYVGRVAPTTRRDYQVTVRRQGGPTSRIIDRPRLGINVWAPSPEEANDLYATIAALLHDYTTHADNPIKSASVYGMTEIREETEAHQRYFTADVSVRTI